MGRRDIPARLKFHKSLFIRAAGFTLAVATVWGALAVGSMLRAPARDTSQPAVAGEQDGKDQTRVVLGATPSEASTAWTAADVSIWHPGKMESAPAEENAATSFAASAAVPSDGWREQEFASVSILDGRTIGAGEVTIRLAGVELPPPEQVCRTLDNRLEQCVTRAATQLELLTRSRKLACRYRMITSSEAVGSCRIGSHDLAERLVRSNYVRAADAGRTVVATMRGSSAAR